MRLIGTIVSGTPRSGVTVIWALVVLTVLAATTATAAWQFTTTRRVLERRQNRVQALWLARSGAELAVARLLADPDGYTGETVALIREAETRITVQKDSTRPSTYRIKCEVQFSDLSHRTESVGLALTWTATRQSDPARIRLKLDASGERVGEDRAAERDNGP